MAENTTNYELVKPGNGDTLDISVINRNMDKLDETLDSLSGALAIVQHTNTATRDIAQNQFVCWKGNLYRASTDITEGDTLSVSNLTAYTGGGFNGTGRKWNLRSAYIGYVWVDPKQTLDLNPDIEITRDMQQHGYTEFGGIVGFRVLDDDNKPVKDHIFLRIRRNSCVVRNIGTSDPMGNITLWYLAR